MKESKVYEEINLTDEQKVHLFDKLVSHAEEIESGLFFQEHLSVFVDQETVGKVRSHALYFLKIVRSEIPGVQILFPGDEG